MSWGEMISNAQAVMSHADDGDFGDLHKSSMLLMPLQ